MSKMLTLECAISGPKHHAFASLYAIQWHVQLARICLVPLCSYECLIFGLKEGVWTPQSVPAHLRAFERQQNFPL